MKNKILILLLTFNISISIYGNSKDHNNILIDYLNNQIHENSVPEFKEFNEKIQKLFQIQNINQRLTMIKDIQDFGNTLIKKLEDKLKFNHTELTSAEKKTLEEVIYKIKEKLKKLVKKYK